MLSAVPLSAEESARVFVGEPASEASLTDESVRELVPVDESGDQRAERAGAPVDVILLRTSVPLGARHGRGAASGSAENSQRLNKRPGVDPARVYGSRARSLLLDQ
jgi:hypothetical protein